jgi:hypothetical protein
MSNTPAPGVEGHMLESVDELNMEPHGLYVVYH